ncbi:ADP-ribosylglycohydrolase family protein [Phaeobacter sp. NW0010-22]|uniref:ADP-ribosylglycohydrolase family protein n=1 Tax=Phaeobacter sp. NW0010-22 TaxID=3135907 RepID=UPI00310579A6
MNAQSQDFDRACGALIGMAIGDALGMPSQTLNRADIIRHYGQITDFVAPVDDHPVSHGLSAAEVTDDTEQTLLLAARLIDGNGVLDERLWAKDLIAWEADVRARGLRDLLGPSTKTALEAMLNGTSPAEAGRHGTTNGAAMRIAPVGVATPSLPLNALIDQVELACRLTHNTGEAIAAAAAVASVINSGIEGSSFDATLPQAIKAAELGQERGYAEGDRQIARKISDAIAFARSGVSAEEFADKIGTSVASHEAIPAAFGVVIMAGGDPWKATLIAANIGDDTDTIGAMSGAMAGACIGVSGFPTDKIVKVRQANTLPIEQYATDLLTLRERSASQGQPKGEAIS